MEGNVDDPAGIIVVDVIEGAGNADADILVCFLGVRPPGVLDTIRQIGLEGIVDFPPEVWIGCYLVEWAWTMRGDCVPSPSILGKHP
jgi:hypothetical protein